MLKIFRFFCFLVIATGFFTAYLYDQRLREQTPDTDISLSSLEIREGGNINGYDEIHKESTIIHADKDGHFRTRVNINGHPLDMLVDTGASVVAISRKDAEKMGYFYPDSDFSRSGKSATDRVHFVEVSMPSIRVGNVTMKDVPTAIVNHKMPPLLGMSFISKLKKLEISNGKLIMQP